MSLWERLFGKKSPGDQTLPTLAATSSSQLAAPSVASPPNRPASNSTATSATNPGRPLPGKDRVVRVFVSSTFRDMIEDRNELMSHVWPSLRKVCRTRAVGFVEVDLRWGVPEEQSQRKETLRHCLAEIKRCRPYFIGLLGERYGWVPGPEAYSPALLDEEDWLRSEVAKRSVTELEILHGVLNDPGMAGRSFFYFRDPKYAHAIGGDHAAENAAEVERQNALKAHIKSVCRSKHIPLREDYADPHALAALVLADLTAAIDAEFPADQKPDRIDREAIDHEAFAQTKTHVYIGRQEYFDRLDEHARGEGRLMVVLGESGVGKSALLAKWAIRHHGAHPEDFLLTHFIGASPYSADWAAMLRRIMGEVKRRFDIREALPGQPGALRAAFASWLDMAAAKGKAILILDGLNQLEDRDGAPDLAWLPMATPPNIRPPFASSRSMPASAADSFRNTLRSMGRVSALVVPSRSQQHPRPPTRSTYARCWTSCCTTGTISPLPKGLTTT